MGHHSHKTRAEKERASQHQNGADENGERSCVVAASSLFCCVRVHVCV